MRRPRQRGKQSCLCSDRRLNSRVAIMILDTYSVINRAHAHSFVIVLPRPRARSNNLFDGQRLYTIKVIYMVLLVVLLAAFRVHVYGYVA